VGCWPARESIVPPDPSWRAVDPQSSSSQRQNAGFRASGMSVMVMAVLLGADLGSANASGKTPAMQKPASDQGATGPARMTPVARDPKIAVAEEFELARKRGTTEALELFILRHPDDPLAERALRLIEQVKDKRNDR
jgi:hypothetical protein